MTTSGAGLAVNSLTSLSPSDANLAARGSEGDADALEDLYERYSQSVFSMGYSILKDYSAAQDVTQEIFLALWSRAGQFSPQKGVFRHWFLHLAHNRVIDELRRRRRAASIDANKSPHDPDPALVASSDTADEAINAVLFGAARDALKTLPEEQSIAIVMAYLEGATQNEIAQITGVPLGTVKTRLRLGLAKLRDLMVTANPSAPSNPSTASAHEHAERSKPWTT